MGKKKKCCEKFKKKGKACGSCPVMKKLSKKERAVYMAKFA